MKIRQIILAFKLLIGFPRKEQKERIGENYQKNVIRNFQK